MDTVQTTKWDSEAVAAQCVAMTEAAGTQQLYLLVDLCGFDFPLPQYVPNWRPLVAHALLFEHTPEHAIRTEGPLLLLIDIEAPNHLTLLQKITELTHLDNRLIAFNSHLSFDLIQLHLQRALQVRWGDEEGVLRYYSPDLFEAVNLSLDEAQSAWFHQYVSQWFFLSDAGRWVCHRPEPAQGAIAPATGFTFTQAQYDMLLLWADVLVFRRQQGQLLNAADYGGEQMLQNQLYVLANEADQQGLFGQQARVQYFFDHLISLKD